MRASLAVFVFVVVSVCTIPARAAAQVSVRISVGANLGPPIPIYAYSQHRYGDWRANYLNWSPVTVYEVNGRYYRHSERGAREVIVYSDHGQYFFPPQDGAWSGFDKRVDYRHRPIAFDFAHVEPYPGPAMTGPEPDRPIVVATYSTGFAGPWRTNLMLWTPVFVYVVDGRYYSQPLRGARKVEIYRYRDHYFLPPDDRAWVGRDKRYDYSRRPDHGRGRGRGN
jgi:hypothetical protein